MNQQHQPALVPPISFAQGGASTNEPDSTIAAFALALRLGATGLAADVWLTADEVPVLHRTGVVGSRFRRRSVASLQSDSLPASTPLLAELGAELGGGFDLSLMLRDPAALSAVVALANEQRGHAKSGSKLWLCDWRSRCGDLSLVDMTSLAKMSEGPERRAAQLSDAGVNAVSMAYSDWTAGLVVLFRRFGILAFGRGAIHERMLDDLLRMGIDAVYSPHVDRMSAAMGRAGW